MRSTVHRPQHADVIATRILGAGGKAAGARLFLGLFAAGAYNRNPRSIPLLRTKVERILARAGVSPSSHDGRALRNILDTWPRDELFQASEAEILEGARIALDLSIRPRPALYFRPDPFGRFVSVVAWLPRESFDTRLRGRVGELLARAHGGRLSAFYIALGDAPLARIHYIIGTDPARVRPTARAGGRVCRPRAPSRSAGRGAVRRAGRGRGRRRHGHLARRFPAAYREQRGPPGVAAADLRAGRGCPGLRAARRRARAVRTAPARARRAAPRRRRAPACAGAERCPFRQPGFPRDRGAAATAAALGTLPS
jgi:glutamate dehydrogenase